MFDDLVLDDEFFNAVPSPDPTPKKHPITPRKGRTGQRSPSKRTPLPKCLPRAVENVDAEALMEGVDWDAFEAEMTPQKDSKKPTRTFNSAPRYFEEPCTRCSIEMIMEANDGRRWQKELFVIVDGSEERRLVILRDDWYMSSVCVGDTIHAIGVFHAPEAAESRLQLSIIISSKSNLLILHPDLLLTATSLSNAPQCRRKPLLSNMMRASNDVSPALVWGNMLHDVTQSCLSSGKWDEAWIEAQIQQVIKKGLIELYKINVTTEVATRELRLRANGLLGFAERYIGNEPKPKATLSNTRSSSDEKASFLAISKLHDIEEDIWSPTLGLKGKLDATVEAVISSPGPSSFFQPSITSGPVPFEIKTGRAITGMEHRAQTMLYTLLAQERYGVQVPSGLLYYTQSDEVVQVPASRNELRGLFQARNEMAMYMMRRLRESEAAIGEAEVDFLPPTIDNARDCKRCYVADSCMLYRRAVQEVVDTSSPIAELYESKTSHLTEAQCKFFKHWENLIALEERDMIRFRKELWTMRAAEREAKGRCFSSMVLDTSYATPHTGSHKIHQFTYRFIRAPNAAMTSLLNGHMSQGDAITISIEPRLLALARGYILELSPDEVIVGVDHSLDPSLLAERLDTLNLNSDPFAAKISVVFRIDRDELFGGMGRIRHNLAQMFFLHGDTRRLDLIVNLRSPRFLDVSQLTETLSPPTVSRHFDTLNVDQKVALHKVVAAEDYALILGMPGTGKTTVIAAMIKTLVELGKTVLLTSYTHSAVDNILLKLTEGVDFGILRLGNPDKVHPDVRQFMLSARQEATTIEQLEHQLMSPPVVATTCLTIDHAIFARRTFDYCIVDEASQITLPTCLGPLHCADKFVLVGDHFQLPPLVRNPAARKGGFDISLFRMLSDAHTHSVADLTHQYRMNEDIQLLSNVLIYNGRLCCGSDSVAQRSLVIPDRAFFERLHEHEDACDSNQCWIEKLLDERTKAVFLDTDNVPGKESRAGELVQNLVEASLVRQVVETFTNCGVPEESIGVLSLYRQQVKVISHYLRARRGVEILTADRSQGRDKECIIISLVRSNDHGHVGDLVKDWRRMNVSFTRARSKLIIIGSRKTLRGASLLAEFIDLMESKCWIMTLPTGADAFHQKSFGKAKRAATEAENSSEDEDDGRSLKRVRRAGVEAILRGRHMLLDLVNEEA